MTGPIEMIIATFDGTNKAGEALKHIKKLQKEKVFSLYNAAVLVRDEKGRPFVKETEDVDTGHGAVFGAIVGGLVGLLGGPAGAVVGAAAGAATGGMAAHGIDAGFYDEMLEELEEHLRPGTSAVVAVVEQKWADRLYGEFEKLGAKLCRRTLKSEVFEYSGFKEDETKTDECPD